MLDLDSTSLARFDEADAKGLQQFCKELLVRL
ncbi:MAG: hypothetical protein ACLVJ6_16830 [Merdibacter sp.]